jgi:hypothetical protein
MILPPVLEFGTLTVVESGVANKERIVFRPTEPLNLVQFGVLICFRQGNDSVVAVHDNCFMFDQIQIAPPSWVVLYTGTGEPNQSEYDGHPVYYRYWGRPKTIFTVVEIVPVLFRLDAITIGGHLNPTPSIKSLAPKQNPSG